jgi:molybdopterin-binding protein
LKARGLKTDGPEMEAIIAKLDIAHLLDKHAGRLSAGEMQRVSLARALVLKPRLILMDEPAANLDPETVARMESMILEKKKNNTTLIMASHFVEQAYRLSAHVIRLEGGKLAAAETDNIFECSLIGGNGRTEARIEKGPAIRVDSAKTGRARLAVSPMDIHILSSGPAHREPVNSLPGKVVALQQKGDGVEVAVDAGCIFKARVTQASLDALGLAIGKEVYISFEPSAVKVF